jgi:hypothetical protein
MTTSFDDKDELKEDIIRLDAQIATLERMQQLE